MLKRLVPALAASLALAAMGMRASAEQNAATDLPYHRPSVVAPRDMAQCQALNDEWQKIRDAVSKRHTDCLHDVASSKRDCPDDPSTGCSCERCAPFHDSGSLGSDVVDECRRQVDAYQRAERERKDREQQAQAQYRRMDEDRERRYQDALQRAAEERRREREALAKRTADRQARLGGAGEQQQRAREAYERNTRDLQDRAQGIADRLQQAIQGLSVPSDTLTAGATSLGAEFDFAAVDAAKVSISGRFGEAATVIQTAALETRAAFQDWLNGRVKDDVTTAQGYLIEAVVQDRSLSELAQQIVNQNVDSRLGVYKATERAFDRIAEAPLAVIHEDVSGWITERLNRTGVASRPWVSDVRNIVVEQGVSYVLNSAAEAMRNTLVEHIGQKWNNFTAGGPPPREGTFARAEYDFWQHAHPANLVLSTLPLRGTAAVRGLYEWGTGLVEHAAKAIGFAFDEISVP